jgi:hypothetical protein
MLPCFFIFPVFLHWDLYFWWPSLWFPTKNFWFWKTFNFPCSSVELFAMVTEDWVLTGCGAISDQVTEGVVQYQNIHLIC